MLQLLNSSMAVIAMINPAVGLKWAGWFFYATALFVISLSMTDEYKTSLVYPVAMGCWLVGAILIHPSRQSSPCSWRIMHTAGAATVACICYVFAFFLACETAYSR